MTGLPTPREARRLLFWAAPIAFGLVALALGMDADWDLRNYHYYNAWALLTGRDGWDMLVSQRPSFYNPALDLPYFLLAQVLPARALAFLYGMLHGLNLVLLTLLGERLLILDGAWRRFGLAALLATAGSCGAVALSEIGTVFYDNLLSLGLFGSLLAVVAQWRRLAEGRRWLAVAVLAGLPAGLAFGLKQTAVMFPVGLAVALLLTLPAPPLRRLLVTFAFGIGVVLATIAGGGYWLWHLWAHYGNPIFPHFNQIFRSPWGLPEAYRDVQYAVGSPWQRLIFPFSFSFDSKLASEIQFRDFRVLTAFLLIPVAGLAEVGRVLAGAAPGRRFVDRGPAIFVLVSAAAAYLVWLLLFAVYRYITALEMASPLLLALAFGLMPGPHRWRLGLTVGLVMLMVATTRFGQWIRVPFTDHAVEVSLPAIADPAHSLVLLAGHEPLSFLLPSFPPAMRFLRIDSNFTNPDETAVRFNQVMRRIVALHQGPLLALFIPTERHDVITRLGDYGLILDDKDCAPVTSPIGAAPYALCPVGRE